jgi:cmgb5
LQTDKIAIDLALSTEQYNRTQAEKQDKVKKNDMTIKQPFE